ncbi:hypothetical protein TSOC_000084 [Tetrabaena socialis]|uniref:Uncharacterized protein n=1 Tax=Tetrabaena socialis TaxID=47790 RepID=A0A2J8AKC2_9CHLO|nr:hypothetical protein TSOC_000084 [Tetrabaena socialis]|eukprot:PNH12959.1 hypothetical protein TSOC_000084 [Tetrabaena socialis]
MKFLSVLCTTASTRPLFQAEQIEAQIARLCTPYALLMTLRLDSRALISRCRRASACSPCRMYDLDTSPIAKLQLSAFIALPPLYNRA